MVVQTFINATLALVYPQSCAVCGESVEQRKDGIACAKCWQRTRIFTGAETACYKCGALAQKDVANGTSIKTFCRRCDEDVFDTARAVGVYEGALRASVLSLKKKQFVSQRLTELLFESLKREPLNSATRIIPIPLHEERLKERGFNQAAVLSKAVAQLSKLSVDENSLVRVVHAEKHRSGMDAKARRDSVKDTFKVVSPRLVKDEKILLVDDVFTTGATVSACAEKLKEAGACKVFVLTVARPIF